MHVVPAMWCLFNWITCNKK